MRLGMHAKYMSYVIQHKFWVFVAGLKLRKCVAPYRVSWLALLFHDMSKFTPSEWIPYAWNFYGPKPKTQEEAARRNADFDKAWGLHWKRNAHHWQFWIRYAFDWDDRLRQEIPAHMPGDFIVEMLCDWMGAGRGITGKWDVHEWYKNNAESMQLSDWTRRNVELFLRRLKFQEQCEMVARKIEAVGL